MIWCHRNNDSWTRMLGLLFTAYQFNVIWTDKHSTKDQWQTLFSTVVPGVRMTSAVVSQPCCPEGSRELNEAVPDSTANSPRHLSEVACTEITWHTSKRQAEYQGTAEMERQRTRGEQPAAHPPSFGSTLSKHTFSFTGLFYALLLWVLKHTDCTSVKSSN